MRQRKINRKREMEWKGRGKKENTIVEKDRRILRDEKILSAFKSAVKILTLKAVSVWNEWVDSIIISFVSTLLKPNGKRKLILVKMFEFLR